MYKDMRVCSCPICGEELDYEGCEWKPLKCYAYFCNNCNVAVSIAFPRNNEISSFRKYQNEYEKLLKEETTKNE